MTVKRPVSGSLARAFFSMIVLSVLISAIALVTLASSQRDAEAINIAGSLRMQSYRLGYEMQRASPSLAEHRAVWQKTLSAPALQKLNRWYVPEDVKQRYLQQLQLWLAGDGHAYRQRRYRVSDEAAHENAKAFHDKCRKRYGAFLGFRLNTQCGN